MIKEANQQFRGLYIHLPFCLSKCQYCDFYSVPLQARAELGKYLQGLAAEIRQRALVYDDIPIRSIYLGGGTPSLLSPELVNRLIADLFNSFPVEITAEITMEANPGTLVPSCLPGYLQAGVNRLSLGVQSFCNSELAVLGRLHDEHDSPEAFYESRRAGFTNVNLDLIYGLPGQTITDWCSNLTRAVKMVPDHLSLYLLQLEPCTPLGRKVRHGELDLPDEEVQLEMYLTSRQILANSGYRQYEISNFARPGKECHHNQLYWNSQEYIGLGAGAVSFIGNTRQRNTTHLEAYLEANHQSGFWQGEILEEMNEQQRWADAVVLGLRRCEGLSLLSFSSRFGVDLLQVYRETIDPLLQGGWLEIADGCLRLTPSSYFISNQILCRFMV